MAKLVFPCGCKFKIVDDDTEQDITVSRFEKLPRVDINLDPNDPNSMYRVSTLCNLTWDMIGRGATKGVFQLEKNLGQQWSKLTKPNKLEDLGALVALLRPGCLLSISGDPPKSMTQRYADRKIGKEETTYLHDSIGDILETTYGVLVYQEQAMRIAERVAAFNKQEADVLRKAIGKKKADIMAKVEKNFLEKAEKAGVITLDEAKEIFGWIRESQKYSFNASHALAYGLDSYWSAYIKAHFPLSFYGAWILGASWKNADKYEEVAELVNDAKLNSIIVKTPQLHSLTESTAIIDDEYIQFGLSEIKGVGQATAKKILEIMNQLGKPIKELKFVEFLVFVAPKLGKTATTALLSIGALDFIENSPRNKKLYEYQQLDQLTDTEMEWLQTHFKTNKWNTIIEALQALQPVRIMERREIVLPFELTNDEDKVEKITKGKWERVWVGGGGTSSSVRANKVNSIIDLIVKPPHKLEDTIEWIAVTEEHYLGTPVSTVKIEGCTEAYEANTTCKEFLEGKDGYMTFALEIVNVEEKRTKKGKNPGSKMAKMFVRDASCTIPSVIFPKEWSEYNAFIYPGNTILAIGERTKDGSLSIKKAKEIS